MAYAIPLNGQTIYTAAAVADISVEELSEMKQEAEAKYRKDKDKEWALDRLGKDEEWHEETMKKIEE